ncbi:MAG: Gx transporter family protein [Oscillospiraceae bacterium]|nr:Gx transporter family protein [Oscillospiraceae bacterium]
MRKTKKLALMAVLTAIALTIFMIESQIPAPVPIPGVKLGLANIITLTTMLILGRKEAGAVLTVRVLMGAVFAGSPASLLYSAMGGLFAYIVMCILVGIIPEKRLWALSALSAMAHNAGQLLACVLVVKTPGVFVYAPALIVSGVITGAFTGWGAMYLVRALRKMKL